MTSLMVSATPVTGGVDTVDGVSARVSLSRADCLSLLAPGGLGRVAASRRAVPVIIPVKFTVVDEDIVFVPGAEDGVSRAITDCVVAFETDAVRAEGQVVWDVHVTGVAAAFLVQIGAPAFRLATEIITGWRMAHLVP